MADISPNLVQSLQKNIQSLETFIENEKQQPYFYFKVKLIANKNNNFQLVTKTIAISKSFIYIFWTEDQQSNTYQAFNNSRKEQIPLQKLQNPQQKIPLSKFNQFTLVPCSDPQYISYIKSLVFSVTSEQCNSLQANSSLLFMKSTDQFQTHCIISPSYTSGIQLLYVLQLMKSLRQYYDNFQKNNQRNKSVMLKNNQVNYRLIRMCNNIKFGFIQADTENFGYNCRNDYGQKQQQEQMQYYNKCLQQILNNRQTYQYLKSIILKLYFKIIDDGSITYAYQFIEPIIQTIQNLIIKGCQLTQQSFESLVNRFIENNTKIRTIKSIPSPILIKSKFQNLKYLNLQKNKLTDNIFASFVRLINSLVQANSSNSKIDTLMNTKSDTNVILFPNLLCLNLSKNYISLQSKQSHNNLIKTLQKLSTYAIKIDLSSNILKTLQFFEKYIINAQTKAGTILSPIEFLNVKDNSSINDQMKQNFINLYFQKVKLLEDKYMANISFIADLGSVKYNRNPNLIQYLLWLDNYYDSQKKEIKQQNLNSFLEYFNLICDQYQIKNNKNQKSPKRPDLNSAFNQSKSVTLSKPKTQQLTKSQSHLSIISPSNKANKINPQKSKAVQVPSAQQTQKALQILTQLFYLKDYKQISNYKQQLTQKHKLSDNILKSSLPSQWSQKKLQQNRLVTLLEQITNFVDFKSQYAIKKEQQQRKINRKIDQLTGIIRRRGLQGRGSQLVVYLKYLRDNYLEKWLTTKQSFTSINPLFQILYSISDKYLQYYNICSLEDETFLDIDYKQLASKSQVMLKQQFFKIKQQQNMNITNEKLYDRLKYLLHQNKFNSIIHIQPIQQTLMKQIKLFPTRITRYFMRYLNQSNFKLIKAKQKLTSTRFPSINNKVQFIRKYSINHYPFNSNITASLDLSGYQGAMSCLTFQESRYEQALSFIQIVNNCITFLFYTPDAISQQTVTYLNYIVTFLNQMKLQVFEDIQFKQFLIEELYLHIMTFKPQQKLAKGILLHVMQYMTSRIICRAELQRYILAYVLQNQAIPLQQSYFILNNVNYQQPISSASSILLKKQTKISWTIPNHFLIQSFQNQGKIVIYLHLDTSSIFDSLHKGQQVIQIVVHQSWTIGQIFAYINKMNILCNLVLQRKLKGIQQYNSQEMNIEIQKYWLYQKINRGDKLHYFYPLQWYKYIGEIISQNYENSQKINIFLRKSLPSQNHLNKKYFTYEMVQPELISLFNKISSNLFMNLSFISKLPLKFLSQTLSFLNDNEGQSNLQSYRIQQLVIHQVLAQIIFINYYLLLGQRLNQGFQLIIEQQEQKILHQAAQTVLSQRANLNGDKVIVNCCLTIQNAQIKAQIIKKVQNKIQKANQSAQNSDSFLISQKIIAFINSIGDIGFCETLIHDNRIFICNHRFFLIGLLNQHRNQLNQIVNIHSKLQYFAEWNKVVDFRIYSTEDNTESNINNNSKLSSNSIGISKTQKINILIQYVQFDQKNRKINLIQKNLQSSSNYFIICVYKLVTKICSNILNFDIKLLYSTQKNGLGIPTKKVKNNKMELYHPQNQNYTQPGLYEFQDKFINFQIIRNKENQKYQRKSVLNSTHTLVKQKSSTQRINANNLIQSNNNIDTFQNNAPSQKQKNENQVQQVFSRKSSKSKLRQNRSQRSVGNASQKSQSKRTQKLSNRNSMQRQSINQSQKQKSLYQQNGKSQRILNNQQLKDDNSLAPSRKSLYEKSSQIIQQQLDKRNETIIKTESQSNLPKVPSRKSMQSGRQLKSVDMIKTQNQNQIQIKDNKIQKNQGQNQNIQSSQQISMKKIQNVQNQIQKNQTIIVTNQARKSRKQLPKRRSRQK